LGLFRFSVHSLTLYMHLHRISPVYLVLLARTFLFSVRPDSKIWIGHETDRRKCYGHKKHRQIRRLGDPNPMDDAPDQDSAATQKTNEHFMLTTRAMLGIYNICFFRFVCCGVGNGRAMVAAPSLRPPTCELWEASPSNVSNEKEVIF